MIKALEILLIEEITAAEKAQDRKIPLQPIIDIYDNIKSEYFLSTVRDYLFGFEQEVKVNDNNRY